MPGMIVLELLAQVASVAMLASPSYRMRTIFVAGYNDVRFIEIIRSGSTIEVTAELHHLRVAHYQTEARLVDKEELPAR
jgi:3-hydroxymyristoyl/3-hydroxydecanoyl-(acyl carrier protein) dehydratase